MGVISGILGLLPSVSRTAEVFVANKTAAAEQEHAEHLASLAQHGAEFQQVPQTWFDSLINAINRTPRPALAIGTLGLFVFAMADPVSFSIRMQGLALVPDQLWWLLGAIVSFYFGARELHHFRSRKPQITQKAVQQTMETMDGLRAMERAWDAQDDAPAATGNAALAEWQTNRR